MKSKFKKDLKYYLIAGGITLGFSIGFFCLFFFLRAANFGYGLLNWQDSLMIVGIIIFCAGALMWVGHEGFFDIFAYGFKQLGGAMFAKNATAYNDFPGYKEDKKIKRASSPKLFAVVMIIGAAILLAALLVYLIFKSQS